MSKHELTAVLNSNSHRGEVSCVQLHQYSPYHFPEGNSKSCRTTEPWMELRDCNTSSMEHQTSDAQLLLGAHNQHCSRQHLETHYATCGFSEKHDTLPGIAIKAKFTYCQLKNSEQRHCFSCNELQELWGLSMTKTCRLACFVFKRYICTHIKWSDKTLQNHFSFCYTLSSPFAAHLALG